MTPLKLVTFPGGLSWPVFVAQDRGLLEQQGLRVTSAETTDSVSQIKGLIAGDCEIVMTPFDNVLAYQEGQAGESLPIEPDLFAFMGGISTGLRLIVRPEITSYAQLRGSTLAVDSLSTGYTLLLYKLLDQHGVAPGTYSLARLGGTASRVRALAAGEVAGTMVSSPQEIALEEQGFRRLADILPDLGRYQALCGVARRSWATVHQDSLVAFIRAYAAASDWLMDPANRSAAAHIYQKHVPNTALSDAEKAWDVMVSPREGFQRRAKFDAVGAQLVFDVRQRFGHPPKQLQDWRTRVDERFYDMARDVPYLEQ